MKITQIFKNYLFSNNLNLINPAYRFSPIFFKRFMIDLLLRLFIFVPFCIGYLFTIKHGTFDEILITLQQNNQNGYGYLLAMLYVYLALIFLISFFSSIVGSVIKLKFKQNPEVSNEYSQNYFQAVMNSWKNLWYLTFETLIILILSFLLMSFAPSAKGAVMNFTAMMFIKSLLITASSAFSLSVFVSLPFLRKKDSHQEAQIA